MSSEPARGLLAVERLVVPQPRVDEALAALRYAGGYGAEAVALWAGVRDGARFLVRETIIPDQTAYRTPRGLLYRVEADELHRVNIRLYDAGLMLGAQLHSHPGEAYHSDTDDAYPIVTALGAASIVIPDFAGGPLDLQSWAIYRLRAAEGWMPLTPPEATSFIEITDEP